ncbi:MAG: phosphoribosylglycinamide formyltransferase [Flavobacteriales bacterium]|nr:phosphoribosylglycinamide formyltransferase [Flavobacteriales bacterium]
MKRIAIFASGSGSNAENIIKYFAGNEGVEVSLILSNHPDAFVLERAKKHQIETVVFSAKELKYGRNVLETLKQYNVSIVILAGFLLKIPGYLIQHFPNAIINIHPALLPKYGGKGMYGMNVHRSVVENQETESGITIHYVNENYDEGAIIFQASCAIASKDSPELVQAKVQELEALHFPKVIESTIQ